MSRTQTVTVCKVTADATHAHWWSIEEAHGPVSAGVCRLCGEHRMFKNWLPEADLTTRAERELVA